VDHIEKIETYSAQNYHPLPIVIDHALGVWVTDIHQKRYLDCLSAYSALNHGHCHPRIIKALMAQAQKVTLTSRAFHHSIFGEFLEKLCLFSGFSKALPMNSGVEAVETAIKAARKWGYIRGIKNPRIIVCDQNFHGRTTTVISFSTEPAYREGFGPFTPGFDIIPFGDEAALMQAIGPDTVGFLVEPIQGEAGIIVPPKGFLQKASAICKQHNVLLMVDEIQSGLGRTGKKFAYEHEGIRPDILIIGKALGGGVYPVSAMLSTDEVMAVFQPGQHGSTFGGNALASAVALESLRVLEDEQLVEASHFLGEYTREQLTYLPTRHLEDIRGLGLWFGLEIKKSSGPARLFCEQLMHLGILAKETHEQVIRIAPPLVIQKSEIDLLIRALIEVLR